MPVAGSAFPGGHNPRAGFLRAAQLPASGVGALEPLVCGEEPEMVEVDAVELVEAIEEEEFWRCTVLRGPVVNIILFPSSESVAPKPLSLEPHARRGLGWKESGGATAVMGVVVVWTRHGRW